MPEKAWPQNRRVIGTKVPRLDGPDKATGRAKYSYDRNREGLLHARLLRCPYAHATLKSLDTAAAEKMPGVKGIHILAKIGKEFFYAGEEVLGIAADTEEHANDALHAVKIEYEVLPHYVQEAEGRKATAATTGTKSNVTVAGNFSKGNVDKAFQEADAVVEGQYGLAVIAHQCLESHGLVAEWDKDGNLLLHMSTQAVSVMPIQFATGVKTLPAKVKCITHYMGGGFGSKFQPGAEGLTCAELARKTQRPVKLFLDRAEEVATGGTRPSAFGTVKIAGTKDGKIIAFQGECYGSPGVSNASGLINELPYIYQDAVPNVKNTVQLVRLNCASQRAWRAPRHPQSCVMSEWPIDDLAAKLGMDPMQLRLKNLPPNVQGNPISWTAIRQTLYADQIKLAAKLAEWEKKWHPPGKGGGVIKHGIGMALHTWGGAGRGSNDVKITISSDGSVLAECSTQDLGTGQRTVLAIVAAEVLGLKPEDITVRIGESPMGRSTPSGGSTTCPGTAPAVLNAASEARNQLFAKIAERLSTKPENLSIGEGAILDKASGKKFKWKEACARLGMDTIAVTGDWSAGLSNSGVCGVQIAEVKVDTETGVVRCTKVVAVQDCGLLINKLCCEAQVAGGVIMGLNPALWEERIMDRQTGRQVNADMEFYKLGGIEDMPEIVVHMMDMPERGVIGIGEPPCISTCAAIGNAVFNAIGVRVSYAPFTPERVLATLAKGGRV